MGKLPIEKNPKTSLRNMAHGIDIEAPEPPQENQPRQFLELADTLADSTRLPTDKKPRAKRIQI